MSGRAGVLSIQTERSLPAAEVTAILERLPDWFGRPEAIAEYAREAERLDVVVARTGAMPIGFLTLKPQTRECFEIAVMAVRPEWRRRGIGRRLVEVAVEQLVRSGMPLLLVRTVGPSYENKSYAETRRFYEAVGFAPVIELPDHFGDGMPGLLMVRPAVR